MDVSWFCTHGSVSHVTTMRFYIASQISCFLHHKICIQAGWTSKVRYASYSSIFFLCVLQNCQSACCTLHADKSLWGSEELEYIINKRSKIFQFTKYTCSVCVCVSVCLSVCLSVCVYMYVFKGCMISVQPCLLYKTSALYTGSYTNKTTHIFVSPHNWVIVICKCINTIFYGNRAN